MKHENNTQPTPTHQSNTVGEWTKGKVDNNLKDGNVMSGGVVVANCYSSLLMPATIKANAARFAMCWNEYDQLKADNEALRSEVCTLKLQAIDLNEANRELLEALSNL